jgi:GT2 family glycosyltransferase
MNWTVPEMWKNGDVWIIGGGPSITKQFGIPDEIVNDVLNGKQPISAYSHYLSPLHDKHVIGINAAYLIGDWIDIVFFGDSKFFLKNRVQLKNFPKLKVACAPAARKYDWVRYLERDRKKRVGISRNPNMVGWNGNSGAAAVSVAVNAGASRIFLLGFDMKVDDKNSQHWHSEYKPKRTSENNPNRKNLPFHKHLKGFPAIARDAKRMGVKIYNVSPDSAIRDFQKISLQEALELSKVKQEIILPDVPKPKNNTQVRKSVIKNRKKTILSEAKIPYGLNEDLAGAYNKAMEDANSDWVILMDHDIFLGCNPHWYEMCLEAVQSVEDNVGLITCVCNPKLSGMDKDKKSQRAEITNHTANIDEHIIVAKDLYDKYELTLRKVNGYKVAGFFMVVRKEAWKKVKFRSVGKGVRKVDWTFCKRLKEFDYQIMELPGLYVYHHRGIRQLNWRLNGFDYKSKVPKKFFSGWNEGVKYFMKHPYIGFDYNKFVNKHFVKGFVKGTVNVAEEYAYFSCPRDITSFDFKSLPEKFVVKATHSSGWNKVVIGNFSKTALVTEMKSWLRKTYRHDVEKHYKQVKPGIVIEEYLGEINDYKFHFFNGRLGFIQADADRTGKRKQSFYDEQWNQLPFRKTQVNNPEFIPKPKGLTEMVDIAHKLDKKIGSPPFVRVDLYNVDGNIYFGEYTFSPAKGENKLIPEIYEKKYGVWMSTEKLTIVTFKWKYSKGIKLPSIDRIGEYTTEHVNRLYYGVKRNLTIPHRFICITDDPTGIECETYPLWDWAREFGGCFTRLKLFDPKIENIVGSRFLMMDLDTIVVGNLDELVLRGEEFMMHTYYGKKFEQVYNGCLWLMVTGSRSEVYEQWKGQESIDLLKKLKDDNKYIGSDQAWINYVLGNNEGRFGEDHGVYDYRRLQIKTPKNKKPRTLDLPDNAKLIMFSGTRDPILVEDKCEWINEHWI